MACDWGRGQGTAALQDVEVHAALVRQARLCLPCSLWIGLAVSRAMLVYFERQARSGGA